MSKRHNRRLKNRPLEPENGETDNPRSQEKNGRPRALSANGIRKNRWLGGVAWFLAGSVISAIITVPITLLFSIPIARMLSFRHHQAVLVGYTPFNVNGANCNAYSVMITPKYLDTAIKSINLRLQFPSIVESVEFSDDRDLSEHPERAEAHEFFKVNGDCTVEQQAHSDLPPNVQLKIVGSEHRDIELSVQELTKDSSFVLIVGTHKGENLVPFASGEGSYTEWGQEMTAPVELRNSPW